MIHCLLRNLFSLPNICAEGALASVHEQERPLVLTLPLPLLSPALRGSERISRGWMDGRIAIKKNANLLRQIPHISLLELKPTEPTREHEYECPRICANPTSPC